MEDKFAHDPASKPGRASRSYMITMFDGSWDEHRNAMADLDTDVEYYWRGVLDAEALHKQFLDLETENKAMKLLYMKWTFEACPETQHMHLHLIMKMSEPCKFTWLKGMPFFSTAPRVNFKPIFEMKGAQAYVGKEESRVAGPWEWGNCGKQGQRNDIEAGIETMQENGWGLTGYKRLAEEHPAMIIKWAKGFIELGRIRGAREPAELLEEIICCWGTPGSGKTHYAKTYSDSVYMVPSVNGGNVMPYFNTYQNEEVCFFDEFQGKSFNLDDWKKIFQPGTDPRKQELLGRYISVQFGSRVAIFCTNNNPIEWWKADDQLPWAIFRRFTKIIWYGGEYGSDANPAWRVAFTGGDSSSIMEPGVPLPRAEFMRFCMRMRSKDLEFIQGAAKRFYYNYREWENGIDVEILPPDDDIDNNHAGVLQEHNGQRFFGL